MIKLAQIYATSLVIFLIFDSVWLIKISPDLYREYIGHLLAESPRLDAALAFYLIYMAGLTWFCIRPSIDDEKWTYSALRAGFFGVVSYATFDLTAQAVFRDWPTVITLIDLAWGSFICSVTTLVCRRIFLPSTKKQ
jgi:uncharacterized membrane protein